MCVDGNKRQEWGKTHLKGDKKTTHAQRRACKMVVFNRNAPLKLLSHLSPCQYLWTRTLRPHLPERLPLQVSSHVTISFQGITAHLPQTHNPGILPTFAFWTSGPHLWTHLNSLNPLWHLKPGAEASSWLHSRVISCAKQTVQSLSRAARYDANCTVIIAKNQSPYGCGPRGLHIMHSPEGWT